MPVLAKEKRRQSRGQRTEERVLDAAEKLFVEGGVETARISRIVEVSGVSVGSVYHHFGSKEGVLKRLIGRFCERSRDTFDILDDLKAQGASADTILDAAITATFQQFRDNQMLYRATVEQIGREPEVWQPLRDLRAYFEARLLAGIEDHLVARGVCDPALSVHRMTQVMLGLLTHHVVFASGPVGVDSATDEAQILLIAKTILYTPFPQAEGTAA